VQADTSIFLSAPFTDTLVCSGDMLNVKFGASPDMRAGNVFIVQLSDTVGSFTSPTTIASIGGVKGGTLAWPVPANIVASNKYQLRIISTKPADTIMLDYVFTLLPTKAPTITIAANPGTHVWPGLNVTFNAAITNGGDTPSYQWRINGANVPGATANPWSTMGIKNNDKVSCVLTSNYPCASPGKDTSNILDMKVAVGISNVEQDSYHIYPNPTNEILYIEGLTPNSTIQLFDVYGRLIYHSIATQKNEAINTSLFAPGNYILQITDPDGERTTRKVVKE
jgi:hypothetical protein